MSLEKPLEILVDPYDDILTAACAIRPPQVEALFAALAARGVATVSWYYCADERGGWLHRFAPTPNEPARSRFDTWRECNLLAVAVKAAHAHGIRLLAGFKPYETGFDLVDVGEARRQERQTLWHGGRMVMGIDPFVVEHPELRLCRRPRASAATVPPRIGAVELWKTDDAPTRIRPENLEFLVSDDNGSYRPLPMAFDFTEEIRETPEDGWDALGKLVTPAGRKVRVLRLGGMDFKAPYWALRCRGLEGDGDFAGLATRMMRAFDTDGRPVDGCTTGLCLVYDPERKGLEKGVTFDRGFDCRRQIFDAPGEYIAFTPEKPPCVTGALCETEPAVRDFWLAEVRAILATGADGVEFRVENHSCMSNEPEAYGFNPAVLAACGGDTTAAHVARVRGDAYTAFLREAAALVHAAGRKLRLYLSIDGLSVPQPPDRRLAFPQNLELQWRRWLREGLADEGLLRAYNERNRRNALAHPLTAEISRACAELGLPLHFSHHVFNPQEPWFLEEARRIHADARFAGLSLYENVSLFHCDEKGAWQPRAGTEEFLAALRR